MRKLEYHEIPAQLFEIPQPPKELWIEGTLPESDTVYLTIVGSRKHTYYGRDVCQMLIEGLAGYPITIVSGLSIGMDTIAHTAALKAGLRTIAFPGSGLSNEVLYPRRNWQLANDIVTSGGALISELAPDTKPALWTFPRRNRLMAGLSHAVLIIEAEEKSGTLITARLALDYNKDVFVVPGSIFSPTSNGTNKLIHDGAHPITSSLDLLHALGFDPTLDTPSNHKRNSDALYETLTNQEKIVFDIIKQGPINREDLVRTVGYTPQELNIILSKFELEDCISYENDTIYPV